MTRRVLALAMAVVDLSHVTIRIAVTASFGSATIPVVGDVGSILPLALCLVKL